MTWLSGWDKRIELAINDYAGDIGGEVTWFPATIHLKDENGGSTKVFLEIGANYKKIAITKVDGETELYGEIEAWNYDAGTPANSTAVIHTSADGWVINDNTKIYLYYDKDHADNDNIDVINTVAGAAVWDGNFKAVYHMVGTGETAIDVGSAASDRAERFPGGYTFIDLNNPADFTGKITNIAIYVNTQMASAKVATFYAVDATHYTARSVSGNLGVVGVGLKNFSVNLNVIAGDFIGIYFTDAADYIDAYTTGGSGVMYLAGDQTACENTEFTLQAGGIMSLYGTGITINILDSTSNNNDGWKIAVGHPAEAAGQVGQAQDFDGVDDRIQVPDTADFDFAGAFTLEAIVNPDVVDYSGMIFYRYDTTSKDGYYLTQNSSGAGVWDFTVFVNPSAVVCFSNAVPSGNAQHIVGVRDSSGNMILYVDGVAQDDTETLNGAIDSNSKLFIGSDLTPATFAKGIMDELRVSSTNRSAVWTKGTRNSLFDTLFTYGDEETAEILLEFSETLSIVDTMATSGTLAKAETLSIVDTKITSGSLELTEALSIVDSWSGLLAFFETLSIADSKFLTGTLGLDETLEIVDSATYQCIKTFYETLSIIDTKITSGSLSLAETLSIVDSWTVVFTLLETISITDTTSTAGTKTLNELLHLIDTFIRWIEHPIFTEPTKSISSYTEPTKTNPIYTEPAKSNPTFVKPTKGSPVYTEPTKGNPIYTEPTKKIQI